MKRFVNKTDQAAHAIAQHVDYRLDAGYTIPIVMDAMSLKRVLAGIRFFSVELLGSIFFPTGTLSADTACDGVVVQLVKL